MKRESRVETRRGILISFVIFGLVAAALVILPYQFESEAGNQIKVGKGLIQRTESHEESLENYDIREDKSAFEKLESFRQSSQRNAVEIADIRESFIAGEEKLRRSVPTLKVEYNSDLRIPEVITPDVWKTNIERLTAPSSINRAETLRNFAKQYNNLVGMESDQINDLKVIADYENPSGNMAFAHLAQEINGIPVFRGEIKAGFTKKGEIVRIINNLAPGLNYESLSSDFRNPLDAVKIAAKNIKHELKTADLVRDNATSTDDSKLILGTGPSATTAEKMYFPTEPGVARPTWRVLIWQPVNAYYVIVDAETGTVLWRKNITEDQTQSATYEIYNNPNAFMNVAESPAPLTPGPINPATGMQGTLLTRSNVTLIGKERENSFNNNGWITDGANGTNGWTDGNATEAGLDVVAPDGVDAPMPGTGRVFSSAWNPPPGNPAPGDSPTTADAQYGAVVQMFYIMNRYHDTLYQLGFTEAAFNFQDNNFGRGGIAGDRIRSEGQDSSGTDNANFSTPSDGGRGRMQMYRFTGPSPNRDGTADADVIVHEATHGTSNRLHNNANGLTANMSRGIGEGWSDFYAHTLLAEPSDPANGIYSTGGYITLNITAPTPFNANYYYGIRRFPKAVISFTGGPNNRPHNPLTFANLNAGNCTTFNSAFSRGPVGSSTCDQLHNAGEIWSSFLWEVRNLMVTRLGFTDGTQRVLQTVTDGMKLDPINPTFIQARDSIIAAASAVPEAESDVADIREGFRRRGMGFSAEILATSPADVVEAYDMYNARIVKSSFSVNDSSGDGDGFPEPGENVLITVSMENIIGSTVTNVTGTIVGGGTVSYGDIPNGQTVTKQIPYTIPVDSACGSFHTVTISGNSSIESILSKTFTFRLGQPIGGAPATFQNTALINVPMGQPGTTSGPAGSYPSKITVSGLTGDKLISVQINQLKHTWVGDIDMLLEGPGGQKFVMMSDAFFANNRTNTISTTLTIRDNASGTMPENSLPPTTGTFQPTNHGANDTFDSPAPAGPYQNPAPSGSATFRSVFGSNGSTMNGDWKLWIMDDAGGDFGTIDGGWKITFESDEYQCSIDSTSRARADFDGDGRTDISVFRPSEGNWYVNGSTSGFKVMNWGSAGDILIPGDYDADGKTDTAIFRPSDSAGVADFYVLNSDGFTVSGFEWGLIGDIPVVGDYDGDGISDIAVFRPSNNTWYVRNSGSGTALIATFGQTGDVPVAGDFDGDGSSDLTVYRNGVWFTVNSSDGSNTTTTFGLAGDILVPADYDGDNEDDFAMFRPSNGTWYILKSSGSGETTFIPFGASGDTPVPGDYDGDGKDDFAVYRNGVWYINASTSGSSTASFGLGSDTAVPNRYLP